MTLDNELRCAGIRVNAVAPQLLDTPANRATSPSAVMAHAGQGSAGRIHIVAIRQSAGF